MRARSLPPLFTSTLAVLLTVAIVAATLAASARSAAADEAGPDGWFPLGIVDAGGRAPTPNEPVSFVWAAMGDSFASGEGNPVGGTPEDTVWGNADVDDEDNRDGCHRSEDAPAPALNTELQARFPTVNFDFIHVACSGAVIADLLNANDDAGPDPRISTSDNAQIADVETFANGRELDALYINIGGNDGGFGDIVGTCLLATCNANMIDNGHNSFPSADPLQPRWDAMRGSFADLDERIDDDLAIDSSRVLITQIPDFSTDTDGTLCTSSDFGTDALRNVTRSEIRFATGVPLATMNANISDAADAHDWTLIDGHLAEWEGHGVCADVPFANTNNAAMAKQGDDFQTALSIRAAIAAAGAGTAVGALLTVTGPGFLIPGAAIGTAQAAALTAKLAKISDGLSAGIAHPNADGYDTYQDALSDTISPMVAEKLQAGLVPPSDLRVTNANRNGDITIGWNDASTTETFYRVRTERLDGRASEITRTVEGATAFTHRIRRSEAVVRYRVQACNEGGCGEPAIIAGGNRAPELNEITTQVFDRGAIGIKSVRVNWASDPAVVNWYVRRTNGGRAGFLPLRNQGKVSQLVVNVPRFEPVMTFDVVGCNHVGCSQVRRDSIDTSVLTQRRPTVPNIDLIDKERLDSLIDGPTLPTTVPNTPPVKPVTPVSPSTPVSPVTVKPATPVVKANPLAGLDFLNDLAKLSSLGGPGSLGR